VSQPAALKEQARRTVTESTPNDRAHAFEASMPESYRKNFDAVATAVHARLAEGRSVNEVRVGTFPSGRAGTALCVVADDRPGLLASISAALVIQRLDVIEAEAYTRREPGRLDEAFDVFWVRHDPEERRGEPVADEDIEHLRSTLTGLLEGRVDRERASDPGFIRPATPSSVETVVRFLEGNDGSFTTLEVETGDRSGLLLALAQALFQQRVQIIASQVKTRGARVFDRFSIVELDGKPIGAARRLEIQVAVMTAVDPIVRG
jgi:[protein-PII] uridylyltransferase